jgi:hypothetical protein
MIADEFFELIPNPPEDFEFLLSRTFCPCRILKAPVKHLWLTRKDRARFPRMVAGCDNEIEALPQEFINGFRPLAREINPLFFHDFDGHRVNPGRRGPCAENLELFSPVVPQEAFRHLASARIMGTEKENPFLFLFHMQFSLTRFSSPLPFRANGHRTLCRFFL